MSNTGKFCIQCRAPLAADALFCPNCGSRQDAGGAPPQGASPTSPQQGYPQPPPSPGYPQQNAPSPVYQQPGYPQPGYPQQSPISPPPRKGNAAAVIIVLLLLLTAVVGGAYWAYAQEMLPEGIQSWADDTFGGGSDKDDDEDDADEDRDSDADESDDADDDDEDSDADASDDEDEDASANTSDDEDSDADAADADEDASASDETVQDGDASSDETQADSDSGGNGLLGGGNGSSGGSGTADLQTMTNTDMIGTWEGTLTFTEINIPDEEKATMSEEDLASMNAMLNAPMPLKFIFSMDSNALPVVDGVISSADLGDSSMDTMEYNTTGGTVWLTYSDGTTDTLFTGTLSTDGAALSISDGAFSIKPNDGSTQGSIAGNWTAVQTTVGAAQ